MARWDPGSEARLREAAIELFAEHGYDAVAVADIAGRAGLTRRSFFRHFPDKREVLFGNASRLFDAIETGIGGAQPTSGLVDVVLDVLEEVGAVLLGINDQTARQKIIDSSPELLERERTKTAAIGDAIARGLTQHEVSADDARLLGSILAQVFRSAYARTVTTTGADFATELRGAARSSASFLQGLGVEG